MFVRVKSKGGPAAEYDIGVEELEANPDLYVVVDKEPVEFARDATYPEPVSVPKTSVADPEIKEHS